MPLYLLEDYITIIVTLQLQLKKKVVEQWKSLLMRTQMHCGLHAFPSLKFCFSLWFFDIFILVLNFIFFEFQFLKLEKEGRKPLEKKN
jgi:hypothetical protein